MLQIFKLLYIGIISITSHYKAWVAKQKILEWLFGMHEKSFQILPRMLLDLEELNSSIVID